MMLLDDWLNQNDIFGGIIDKAPEKTFLKYMSAADFSYYCRLNWGDRIVAPKMESADIDGVITQILATLGDKWDSLFNFTQLDLNLGASVTHKTGEKYSGNTERNTSTGQNNKVSAFNSDALITDTGSDSTGLETTKEDYVKDYIDDTFNVQTAVNNLPLIQKTNIIKTVVHDVVHYITLSIY